MNSLQNRGWRWTALVLRVLLGAAFVYGGWAKLHESWRLFAMDIEAYKVIHSMVWIEVIARGLPWLEVLLGLWLIAGVWLRGSSTVTAVLLAGFIGLMIWAQVKHLDINCGCFGSGEKISWLTLLRDGSLLAAALVLAAWSYLRSRRPPRPPISGPLPG